MSNSNFVKGECRHCGGHLEFPADAGGETIACPHCGQPTELPAPVAASKINGSKRPRWGLAVAVGVAVAGLAAGYFVIKKPVRTTAAATPAKAAALTNNFAVTPAAAAADGPAGGERTNDFSVSDIKLEKRPGSSLVYVTGTVQNLSPRQRFGVKVEFALFDQHDQPAGKAADYQPMLEANGHWSFKAMVMDSKAASARLNFIHDDQR